MFDHYPEREVIDAYSPLEFESMKSDLEGKKLALAIITNHDSVGIFNDFEERILWDFEDMPDYKIYFVRPENMNGLLNCMRDYSLLQPIDTLILAYHGLPNLMGINSEENLTRFDCDRIFEHYGSTLSNDAVVLLSSCSTGGFSDKDEWKNLAISISNSLKVDVISPKHLYALESSRNVSPISRVGEFAYDENGRASFDYDNFESYSGHGSSVMGTSAIWDRFGRSKIIDRGKDNFFIIDR